MHERGPEMTLATLDCDSPWRTSASRVGGGASSPQKPRELMMSATVSGLASAVLAGWPDAEATW